MGFSNQQANLIWLVSSVFSPDLQRLAWWLGVQWLDLKWLDLTNSVINNLFYLRNDMTCLTCVMTRVDSANVCCDKSSHCTNKARQVLHKYKSNYYLGWVKFGQVVTQVKKVNSLQTSQFQSLHNLRSQVIGQINKSNKTMVQENNWLGVNVLP